MLFAGRKLSFINSKYNLNDKLNNMLEKTSYEINPDTIISTKMIDSFFTFFENILKSDSNSESLLRINSNQEKNIKKVSSYVEHTKNQNRDNNFNISSIPLTFKKRKPWKYGPDRLPVPNQYIHRSHKENVFEKEGNWGKIIKIRKR